METVKTDFVDAILELLEREVKPIADYGLYKGNMGMVLVYHLVQKCYPSTHIEKNAEILLDSVAEQLTEIRGINYASGRAGIGWAIEWMAQHQLLEVNTDDLLQGIDDVIYREVIYAEDKSFTLANGSLGKLVFFLKRYKSVNFQTHRLRNICHQECLVFLTDEIKMKLLDGKNPRLKATDLSQEELSDLAMVVITMTKVQTACINLNLVDNCIEETMAFILQLLKERTTCSTLAESICLLKLAYTVVYTGQQQHFSHWRNLGATYVQQLLAQIDEEKATNTERVQLALLYSLLYINTEDVIYLHKRAAIVEGIMLEELPFELKNGLGILTIAFLATEHPHAAPWEELLLI
ncbi:MAG: hypothetical protein JO154_19305 [Chitinophaga sp.]|uniref:lanthionine synthetase LanC family protein n=1 Tax=Chitinophaga sp. TaxID=1869181 RepID=UPI0025C0F527|nr:lanthionine synthetase LanC family protein [Chitinophaga sp.]MBV8254757.1 hypothetical protein [Chitinophaga sp.]